MVHVEAHLVPFELSVHVLLHLVPFVLRVHSLAHLVPFVFNPNVQSDQQLVFVHTEAHLVFFVFNVQVGVSPEHDIVSRSVPGESSESVFLSVSALVSSQSVHWTCVGMSEPESVSTRSLNA